MRPDRVRKPNNHGSKPRKRPDGLWQINLSAPDGNRISVYAKSERLAKEKAGYLIEKIRNSKRSSGEVTTVRQLLEKFLVSKRRNIGKKIRPTTLRRYEEIVRLHLIPQLGKKRLWLLNADDIEEMMVRSMSDGQSPRSVTHHRAVLRAALNYGIKKEWIYRNAADKAAPPYVADREINPLTRARARAMLIAFKGDRLEALFLINLIYGQRQSETLGLKWHDVDFAEGELRIQRSLQKVDGIYQFLETKNQSSRRTLPLYSRLTAVLKAHWDRQANERLAAGAVWLGAKWGDLIFTNEIGEPLSGFTVSRRFRKLLKLAELSDMTYNECRNGTATLLAALGVPDRIAMEIAGHSQIGTTMNIYARVASEDMKEAIDKLGSELWGAVA